MFLVSFCPVEVMVLSKSVWREKKRKKRKEEEEMRLCLE
jgi:hypothetical protein